jgi:hypothetical protein
MRKRNITLDHPDCGIRHDQPCKWGIEWDFVPQDYTTTQNKAKRG